MLSFENLVTIVVGLVTIAGAVAGTWNSLSSKIDKTESDMQAKIDAVEAELNEFKLAVAKEYASVSYLKDVEERLVGAIQGLSRSVDSMPGKVAEIFNAGRNNRH